MLTGTPDRRPGRVDRDVGGGPQRGDLLGPVAPAGEALAPRRRLLRRRTRRGSRRPPWPGASSTHGRKSAGARPGNVRQRLVRSPFGSISSVGMPAARHLLDQHDAETGLARAGHADDHAVGRQVLGLEADVVAGALVGRRRRRARRGTALPSRANVAADAGGYVHRRGVSRVPGRGDRLLRAAGGRQHEGRSGRPTRARSSRRCEAPMAELCDELEDYGPFHLFRPYNDVRFAKDRPPYKTAQGAVRRGRGRRRVLRAALGRGPDGGGRLLRDGEGPARAVPGRRRRRCAPEPEVEELVAELDRRRATRSAPSTSSRRRRAATPRTTRASTCCAARA